MKPTCLYFSRFILSTDFGGGSRRAVQLIKNLPDLDLKVVSSLNKDDIKDIPFDKLNYRSQNLVSKIIRGKNYKKWSNDRRDGFFKLRAISNEWAKNMHRFSDFKLFLVDDPIYFLPLVKKLKKNKCPVISFSHNLETLSPYQVRSECQKELFFEELRALELCDLVVTISREETWLLNNLNISTLYFPYFPVNEIYERLIAVRRKRINSEKKNFLVLGSAVNVTTKNSMIQVIHYWKEKNISRFGDKLMVAGYKSDIYLKDVTFDKNIMFLGPLSNEKHDEILSSVKAVVVYQKNGSGALTRIIEMLTAGVPVIVNSAAARSYYNMKGLIEFRELNDLERALKQMSSLECQIPIPPKPDASLLVSEIKKILSMR
jgi:hypothetical protein